VAISNSLIDRYEHLIKKRVSEAVANVMRQHEPEVREIKDVARQELMQGVIGDLLDESDRVDAQLRVAKRNADDFKQKVRRSFPGEYPSFGYTDDSAGEWLNTHLTKQTTQIAEKRLQQLPWFTKVDEIRELTDSVEETLLLATSQKSLVTLYSKIIDQLGIKLRGFIPLALEAPKGDA